MRNARSGASPVALPDIDDRQTLEADLSRALDEDQFYLAYQPIFDLSTDAVVGAEALLRWLRPDRGTVHPDQFIPALESSGRIAAVGKWVLEESCRQGAIWQRQGHRVAMAVNISGRQLELGGVVDDVRSALDNSGLDPGSLILELTEISLMQGGSSVVPRLRLLKDLGVSVAIDDFGSGYSSVSYLEQFPVDILKIDESFVSRMSEIPASVPAVRRLVQLGNSMGLRMVAEGIETAQQKVLLRAESVHYGQGVLLAPPIDARGVEYLFTDPAT